LLRPSDYHKGDKLSFLESRGLNGITGAASFTALSLSGIGLGKLAESAAVKDTFIAPYLRSNITQGILSGIPAGTVSAELSAWRQGKAVPTLQDWGQAVYGYSLVGGVLGAAHTIKSNPNFPRFENLTNKVQERLSSMKSTANDAMDRAANTLFPENRWGPALAGATLGASYDSVAPLNMTQQSDGSFARPLSAILSAKALASAAPDTVRDQTQSFRDLERVISRGHDHQDFVQNQLRNTLTTLQKQGKVGNEWEVYPTKAGSPADKIGADYILVNTMPDMGLTRWARARTGGLTASL
jgi:hypothetical protein